MNARFFSRLLPWLVLGFSFFFKFRGEHLRRELGKHVAQLVVECRSWEIMFISEFVECRVYWNGDGVRAIRAWARGGERGLREVVLGRRAVTERPPASLLFREVHMLWICETLPVSISFRSVCLGSEGRVESRLRSFGLLFSA